MPKGAKKEETNYTQQILSLVLSLFEENKESLLKKLGGIINFRKAIRRYVMLIVIAITALFITLEGLGMLISSFLPEVRPGIVQILVGLAMILVAIAYNKLWKP